MHAWLIKRLSTTFFSTFEIANVALDTSRASHMPPLCAQCVLEKYKNWPLDQEGWCNCTQTWDAHYDYALHYNHNRGFGFFSVSLMSADSATITKGRQCLQGTKQHLWQPYGWGLSGGTHQRHVWNLILNRAGGEEKEWKVKRKGDQREGETMWWSY